MKARLPLRYRTALFAVAGAALALTPSPASAQQRTIDGSGNNLANPTAGMANTPLLRRTTVGYGNGSYTPAGASRPSARHVSNELCAQSGSMPNDQGVSDMTWLWGQFLDHDMDLTETADPPRPFDIEVPLGDPFFDPLATGTAVIGLNRSHFVWQNGVRQQVNAITTWIDGSNVYGSDDARAAELRMLDGTGRLKTSDGNMLPFNVNGFPNGPTAADPTLFLAGDVRANEHVGLTAIHTLFVREHNLIAELLYTSFPGLDDDVYYEFARMIVGAEIQAITYREFLPTVLGPDPIGPYPGYIAWIRPGIENLFSTACYRFGHTMLSPMLMRRGPDFLPIPDGDLPLREAFFNPAELLDNGGVDPLLRGMCMQPAQAIDTHVVDEVRNFLFGPPGAGGFDLPSLNIQRGRDHGLPDYNTARVDVGLAAVTSFAEITSDPNLQVALEDVYGSVDDIDVWVGGLAEDHLPGALVGELIHRVLAEQFWRLRSTDRFFYQAVLPIGLQRWVEAQTLSVIIKRNTSIEGLPSDAFRVPTSS